MKNFKRVDIDHKKCFGTPSIKRFSENGVYVSESLIAQTYTYAYIVYFVSGTNGDEFGQFDTLEKALEKATEMSRLTQLERAAHDQ